VAFRKVPRIRVRLGQQQYFPFEVGKGMGSIIDYSSTLLSNE